MNKPISNSTALRNEITRLKSLSEMQEKVIREDIKEIREQLQPKNILLNAFQSMTGIQVNTKDLFAGGITAGLLLLLRKTISRGEAKAEEKIYEMADGMFARIRKFLSSVLHVRKHYADNDGE